MITSLSDAYHPDHVQIRKNMKQKECKPKVD
uniref:Uncharacterized protein n=1 Tax=Arundo donax TaxID=35708 RepID=A0A0A9HSN3_ARUDO